MIFPFCVKFMFCVLTVALSDIFNIPFAFSSPILIAVVLRVERWPCMFIDPLVMLPVVL